LDPVRSVHGKKIYSASIAASTDKGKVHRSITKREPMKKTQNADGGKRKKGHSLRRKSNGVYAKASGGDGHMGRVASRLRKIHKFTKGKVNNPVSKATWDRLISKRGGGSRRRSERWGLVILSAVQFHPLDRGDTSLFATLNRGRPSPHRRGKKTHSRQKNSMGLSSTKNRIGKISLLVSSMSPEKDYRHQGVLPNVSP